MIPAAPRVGPAHSEPEPDWGLDAPSARSSAGGLVGAGVAALATAATAGLAGGLAAGGVGALAGAALAALALGAWVRAQPRRPLRAFAATPLEVSAAPRLHNLVGGLAAALGSPPPDLFLIAGGGPNAAVAWSRGPCLAVTQALLDSFTRTEQEAVVAHCLVRLQRSPGLRHEALASAAGPLWRPRRPLVTAASDVRAAALTRYPPGLAQALRKASPPSRLGPYWFVAEGPSHEPTEARLEALATL